MSFQETESTRLACAWGMDAGIKNNFEKVLASFVVCLLGGFKIDAITIDAIQRCTVYLTKAKNGSIKINCYK